MSSPERQIEFSPKARQDFIDILRHTGKTWGLRQLDVYRDKIDDALKLISRNPHLGHRDQELADNHRLYLVGAHVIVYRIEEKCIGVIRILHQRMQASRHLPKR